jgi:hypothetical protein
MRTSSSSYGTSFGRPLDRNPWANDVSPSHNRLAALYGLGEGPVDVNVTNTVATQPLGEMQSFGWILTGAAIGWAASAYSTGKTTSAMQFVAAWGGASTGAILLGVRRLLNGDQNGLGTTLLGAALGVSGYYFGEAQRNKRAPGWIMS